jgi:ankyrin repeat protein
MHFAAREASLESIKLLISHGGKVENSDLIAQAAIGHSWGREGRYEMIDFLLGHGASINAMALKHSVNPYLNANSGSQTALNVAQISGDERLAKWLLERGVDPSIKPIDRNLIEGYPYLGEEAYV